MLGPALWHVVFNQLLELDFREGMKRMAYANDVVLIVYGISRGEVEVRAGEAVVLLCNRAK